MMRGLAIVASVVFELAVCGSGWFYAGLLAAREEERNEIISAAGPVVRACRWTPACVDALQEIIEGGRTQRGADDAWEWIGPAE